MTVHTVTNQAELDTAIAAQTTNPSDLIEIRSPSRLWLRAFDSSTVRAFGSSTVRAYDSSTVRAYDSSTVEACGSSTVEAYGSSTVEAYDSSTVEAYDSSTVEAYGSSTVRAYGSSTVEAYDSSTVRAYGSSTVRAYGSSTVRAFDMVAVHRWGGTVTGGVQIDCTRVSVDLDAWAAYGGIDRADGRLLVVKAVRDDWQSAHGAVYEPGTVTVATDWDPRRSCGNGLHFSASPRQAAMYDAAATRFVRCAVDPAETVVIDESKIKARSCVVVCEIDRDGEPIMETAR